MIGDAREGRALTRPTVPSSEQTVLVPSFQADGFLTIAAGNNNHYYWLWYADHFHHFYAVYVATHVVLDPKMAWNLPYLGPPPHFGNAVVQPYGLGPVNTQNVIQSMIPVSPTAFAALADAHDLISVDRWRLDPNLPNLKVYGSILGALKDGHVNYLLDGPGLGESGFSSPLNATWDGLDNFCITRGHHVLYNTLASEATTEVKVLVDGHLYGYTRPLRDPRVPTIRPIYVWAPATAHSITVEENHGLTHSIGLPCNLDDSQPAVRSRPFGRHALL